MTSRNEVVKLAQSWVGLKESDGSFKKIIDLYNTQKNPPRGIKMQYDWSWCACTWSAIAIKLGYTAIMPVEISCGELIKAAQKIGIWQENDGYIPKPADAVLYDWDDDGKGDNTGWPDHVGVVEYVDSKSGYFTVIEGNYSNSVKKRTVSINGKFIRGFITPKYDKDTVVYETIGTSKDVHTVALEVIQGVWGSGDERKERLKKAGLDYATVQAEVNKILNGTAASATSKPKVKATCKAKYDDPVLVGTYKTTANLYCRNDAGNNKKALCLIPKGKKVTCSGEYNKYAGERWPLVKVTLDGIKYVGFSCEKYLKKV